MVLAFASLDQNIVGVALPQIVSDLGGLSHLPRVVAALEVFNSLYSIDTRYGKLRVTLSLK